MLHEMATDEVMLIAKTSRDFVIGQQQKPRILKTSGSQDENLGANLVA
jgi:hypothetical protein